MYEGLWLSLSTPLNIMYEGLWLSLSTPLNIIRVRHSVLTNALT